MCVVVACVPAVDRIRQGYSVRVAPTKFFSGELRRLEAHLDFLSADAFKVTTEGPVTVVPTVEVWCDSKRVDCTKYGFREDDGAGEVTLTVRRIEGRKADKTVFRVAVGGLHAFRCDLERPMPRKEEGVEFGPFTIDKPIVLQRGSDSAVIWAMGGGKGPNLERQDGVEHELKRLPWAIVLRLSMVHRN
jgi:hypothetical protein